MIEVLLNRVLVETEQLKKEHDVGNGVKLEISYGQDESRHEASRTEGTVVSVGPTAYTDLGYDAPPIAVGDHVVFAKYSGVFVTDPETKKTLVVLNDSDVLCKVHKGDE